MRKHAGTYSPMYYALLGALAGSGASKLAKGNYLSPVGIGGGALAGAGLGLLVNKLTYSKPKVREHIEPGFYYGARDLMGDNRLIQDIPLLNSGLRHSFLFGVFDKKPKKLPSIKLPNGQYATTFTGNSTIGKDRYLGVIPKLDLYAAVLDKANVEGLKPTSDIKTLKHYVNPNSVKNWDGNLRATMLAKGDKKAKQLSRRAAAIIAKWDNKRLGDYRVFSAGESYGNCNTVASSLMDSLDIPDEVRPWRAGAIGGVYRSAMSKYRHLMDRVIPDELFVDRLEPARQG